MTGQQKGNFNEGFQATLCLSDPREPDRLSFLKGLVCWAVTVQCCLVFPGRWRLRAGTCGFPSPEENLESRTSWSGWFFQNRNTQNSSILGDNLHRLKFIDLNSRDSDKHIHLCYHYSHSDAEQFYCPLMFSQIPQHMTTTLVRIFFLPLFQRPLNEIIWYLHFDVLSRGQHSVLRFIHAVACLFLLVTR